MKTAPHYSIPEAACRAFAEQEFPIAYGGRPVPGPEYVVYALADAVGQAENLPASEGATADFWVSADRAIQMTRVNDLWLHFCVVSGDGRVRGIVTSISTLDRAVVIRTAAEVYRRLRAEFGHPKLA